MTTARIVGVGKALPARVLTNDDLERMVDTNDAWIQDRTGIRERRIVSDDEGCASMGTAAALMALETAGISAEDIDLVVCATCTGDGMFPATASLIQDAIGATRAAAFDVNAVCVGFIAAFSTAVQFIEAGAYKRVLVVGTDVFSRIVDWTDRGTCILFGDGAGAVVLEQAESGGVGSSYLRSDGSLARLLYASGPTTPPRSPLACESYHVVMDGKEVFRVAVKAMEEATRKVIADVGLEVDDIALIIPHQANKRIITATAKAMGLPQERMYMNIARYGNTSAATIPIALCEAWEEGLLKDGDHMVFVAVGGGLTWGANLVEWTGLGSRLARATAAPVEAGSQA